MACALCDARAASFVAFVPSTVCFAVGGQELSGVEVCALINQSFVFFLAMSLVPLHFIHTRRCSARVLSNVGSVSVTRLCRLLCMLHLGRRTPRVLLLQRRLAEERTKNGAFSRQNKFFYILISFGPESVVDIVTSASRNWRRDSASRWHINTAEAKMTTKTGESRALVASLLGNS